MTQSGFEDAVESGIRISYEAYATGEPQAWIARFFRERAERKKKRWGLPTMNWSD